MAPGAPRIIKEAVVRAQPVVVQDRRRVGEAVAEAAGVPTARLEVESKSGLTSLYLHLLSLPPAR